LARGLANREHDVDLYAASGSEVAGVRVVDTGVDHRQLEATLYRAAGASAGGSGVAEAAFARVYAAVGERRYDVVHNHAFDAPAVSLAASVRAPVVHTLHLPPDEHVARALRRSAESAAIACVSVSQGRAWRRVVPVDAILPPYVPTRSIPFSAAG